MNDAESAVRALLEAGDLSLPLPAHGQTAERHLGLYEIARRFPLSVARLAEAHTDAVAILSEAGREPRRGALYGVWASSRLADDLTFDRANSTLCGNKPFCSGAGVVDRALVTALDGRERVRLVDIDAHPGPTLGYDTSGWQASALVEAVTGDARFDSHPVGAPIVGEPNRWYLDRPGFWYGACGPAACWAGGAAGLVDLAERMVDEDPHRRAHLGAMRAARWAMEAALVTAGHEIDRSCRTDGRRLAISVRHTVERLATDVLDRFGQALGPRPFVADPTIDQRWRDTHLYMRQHHGDRDLVELGRLS